MDDVKINTLEKPTLKNTILIEGLPGIGLVGKLAAEHMLEELKAKKFAELYSPHLPPQVVIQEDGTVKLVNMEFYYWKGKSYNLIFLMGDFQGLTPESQYTLSSETINFVEGFGLKRIFTLGGLGTGNLVKEPKVFGAVTNKKLVLEMKKYGIIFRGGSAIFGAAGLLIGLGMLRNYDGICLMGETHGQIIDAKAAESVLNVLTKILGIKIGMEKLKKKAKETEVQMKKMKHMISEQEKIGMASGGGLRSTDNIEREAPTYIR